MNATIESLLTQHAILTRRYFLRCGAAGVAERRKHKSSRW